MRLSAACTRSGAVTARPMVRPHAELGDAHAMRGSERLQPDSAKCTSDVALYPSTSMSYVLPLRTSTIEGIMNTAKRRDSVGLDFASNCAGRAPGREEEEKR